MVLSQSACGFAICDSLVGADSMSKTMASIKSGNCIETFCWVGESTGPGTDSFGAPNLEIPGK